MARKIKDKIDDSQTFQMLLAESEDNDYPVNISDGWVKVIATAQRFYEPGTDFRQIWMDMRGTQLSLAQAECSKIISDKKDRAQVNHESIECRERCIGCRDYPLNKQVFTEDHSFKADLFSLYCPKYNIDNLCSFLALEYHCLLLHSFLNMISVNDITGDLLQEVDAMCNIISEKVYMLVGVHDQVRAKKEIKIKSGKGQQMAMERRLIALIEKLKPLIKGDELKIDKGCFFKLLCEQFTGSEQYPRDPKTVKAYKDKIEERKNIKITWEKGTIIPE